MASALHDEKSRQKAVGAAMSFLKKQKSCCKSNCFHSLQKPANEAKLNDVAKFMVDFSKLKTVDEQREQLVEMMKTAKDPDTNNGDRFNKFRVPTPSVSDNETNDKAPIASHYFCKKSFVAVTRSSTCNWDLCRKRVTDGAPPAADKHKTKKPASEEDMANRKKDRLELSRELSRSRKKKDNEKAMLDSSKGTPGSRPATFFIRGNKAKRDEGRAWLENLHQTSGLSMRRQEQHGEQEKGMPPPHLYDNYQFYNGELLDGECDAIKVLGDATFKKKN